MPLKVVTNGPAIEQYVLFGLLVLVTLILGILCYVLPASVSSVIAPVQAATRNNVSLTQPITSIDGAALEVGDRVLLMGQTNSEQNGLYCLDSSNNLTRCSGYQNPTDFVSGSFVYVEKGTVFGGQTMVITIPYFTFRDFVYERAIDQGLQVSSYQGVLVPDASRPNGMKWSPQATLTELVTTDDFVLPLETVSEAGTGQKGMLLFDITNQTPYVSNGTSFENLANPNSILVIGSENTADTYDIGFVGQYVSGDDTLWAGLVRSGSDKFYHCLQGIEDEPTSTSVTFDNSNHAPLMAKTVIMASTYSTTNYTTPSVCMGYSTTNTGLYNAGLGFGLTVAGERYFETQENINTFYKQPVFNQGLYGISGTSSALAYYFSSSTNTGWYFDEDQNLVFVRAGVIVAQIGLDGVTTFPNTGFRAAKGTAGAPTFAFTTDPDTGINSDAANTIDVVCGGTKYLTTTVTTNLTANAPVTATKLKCGFYGDMTIPQFCITEDRQVSGVYITKDHEVGLTSNGIRRYAVTPDAGISYQNLVPDTDNAYSCGSASKSWTEVWAANGTIQTSDIRVKQNIQPLAQGLDLINQLSPVQYQWKDKRPDTLTHHGFLAQEMPQEIVETDDTGTKRFNYAQLIGPLLNAVRELKSITERQKSTLTLLEQRRTVRVDS